MTEPLSLFDMPPDPLPVRSSDPATSRAAARSVDMGARKQEVIDAMRYLGYSATAHEIHAVCVSRMEVGAVRSRLSQLRRDGRVRVVGVKRVPKPLGTGRDEQTWMLT